jgi:phenylpropionate dioxygenase-like ring-hydroxylating dioxygenase large terminal subunit
MKAELNELITRIGPGTPCGDLMRRYWQPVALVDEFNPALDPNMGVRPVKAVRVLGQNFVLFKNASGEFGLLDRDCPHRGADLAFGRNEGDGLRCPFHGWKFDTKGLCTDTPAEPAGSTLCKQIKQRSYPLVERSGVLFGWFGPEGTEPPPFPAFDCFTAPNSHTFAFKGLWNCNWLQAFEVGIDPAHASFLHRFFVDESLDASYGRQFRGASLGELDGQRLPMTKVMREFDQPDISFATTPYGLQLTSLRKINEQLTHTRITNAIFPHTFVIPLSETMTITQIHVPVDDTHNYWYAIFTSFDAPVDKETMRNQRLEAVTLPDYIPKSGEHNQWGFSAQEQQTRTYLGMGESDINVHDQWACESMGAIQDRTREHLGSSDKVILANRRMLRQAIETVQSGGTPPGVGDPAIAAKRMGPDTVDGLAPTGGEVPWWHTAVQAKRDAAPWDAALKDAS